MKYTYMTIAANSLTDYIRKTVEKADLHNLIDKKWGKKCSEDLQLISGETLNHMTL